MNTDELKKILDDHALWIKSGSREGARAVLCGANLTGTNLAGATPLIRVRAYLCDSRPSLCEGERWKRFGCDETSLHRSPDDLINAVRLAILNEERRSAEWQERDGGAAGK